MLSAFRCDFAWSSVLYHVAFKLNFRQHKFTRKFIFWCLPCRALCWCLKCNSYMIYYSCPKPVSITEPFHSSIWLNFFDSQWSLNLFQVCKIMVYINYHSTCILLTYLIITFQFHNNAKFISFSGVQFVVILSFRVRYQLKDNHAKVKH